jgi:hypothetical protein
MRPHVERLAASLLAPGDCLIDDTSAPNVAAGRTGRAFCPTPRAIALLRRAGAEPEPHPPASVLRRVNGRAFCASLGPTLPGAAFVTTLDAALDVLASAPPGFEQWRLKRSFGMAGRGQRVVTPGKLVDADHALLRAAMSEGGLQIEPNVGLVAEYAMHGRLSEHGDATFGRLVEQRCDARGQWLSTSVVEGATVALAPDNPRTYGVASATVGVAELLDDEVRRVARALHEAGYFGPFGIDAFVYRDAEGRNLLQPRSEINARYSMGFAVGFGR